MRTPSNALPIVFSCTSRTDALRIVAVSAGRRGPPILCCSRPSLWYARSSGLSRRPLVCIGGRTRPERDVHGEALMNICIFGAGAIGGYLAVELALAGHEICVIARGAHLGAIRERGLTLIIQGREK